MIVHLLAIDLQLRSGFAMPEIYRFCGKFLENCGISQNGQKCGIFRARAENGDFPQGPTEVSPQNRSQIMSKTGLTRCKG